MGLVMLGPNDRVVLGIAEFENRIRLYIAH